MGSGADYGLFGTRPKRWLFVLVLAALLFITLSQWALGGSRDGRFSSTVYSRDSSSKGSGQLAQAVDYSCQAVSVDPSLWTHAATNGSRPFVVLPQQPKDGSLPKQHRLVISAGQPICVRVVVPPQAPANSVEASSRHITQLYQPIAGSPGMWDSIILDAVGAKTGASVPVTLSPLHHLNMIAHDLVHIYEGELRLYDSDVFRLDGTLEYREARWNYEPPATEPFDYTPESIDVPGDMHIEVVAPQSSPYHINNYVRLPLCTRSDEPGRWLPASSLPFAAASQSLPVVKGRVWLPYRCRLRGYSYSAFLQCLDTNRPFSPDRGETYTIHWFGDTNTRRSLKKITSLGKWCSGGNNHQQFCECDDSGEVFSRFTGQNSVRNTLFLLNDEDGGWSTLENGEPKTRKVEGPLARIYFHRWEGLTVFNGGDWRATFDGRNLGMYPRADLVVISLSNMDAAFAPFLEYTRQLGQLIEFVKQHYDDRHIVLRSPQYFCCRSPGGTPLRRVQKDRSRLYGEYTRRLFEHHFPSLVHVWDVSSIAETLPLEQRKEIARCQINGVPADMVDVENLLLFNGLCNAESFESGDKPDSLEAILPAEAAHKKLKSDSRELS
ncbi:hypothetical protein GGI12_000838 [Dipsacomyces acuminosporus]|nr:hypothetical protein GGI12_000838 [Dipsacomyces acuminosporus]